MAAESIEQKKKRLKEIIQLFKKYYPDAKCALNHKNPEELLIATILSAQCTDERVNKVTIELFEKFPSPKALAEASVGELEAVIRSTGFFHNKAKNIKACCELLVKQHSAKVPQSMEALTALPGVGRKTANVVLGNGFGIASGVVVDTHVTRLSNRLGFVKSQDAVAIEKQLNELVPKSNWIMFSHWLITHGRLVCKARTPKCHNCFLESSCPKRI